MPSGPQTASHAAPAIQNGHTGRCRRGAGTPATLATMRDQLVQRRDLAAGQDVGAVRGRRVLAAQPKAFDEIVDVGQMVVDLAAAERDPAAPRDAAKQLQQPAIAGTVDAAGPRDRDLDAEPRARFAREPLAFELRLLIDVARPERRVFVGGRMLDIAVHADRAAVDHAAHAGAGGRFDELAARPSR